jgi:ABC-2 type transport system permease protein
MLRRIITHEWRVLRADRTLWLLAALLVALVAYAYRNGVAWERAQRQTLAQVLADDSTRLATLAEGITAVESGRIAPPPAFQNPTVPATVGRSLGTRAAVLPPGPLAATAIGQGDLFPSYAIVSTAAGDPFRRMPSLENPLHLLAGRFDLAFVVVFLLPLLLLASGYGLLSQEREDGTLALLLTQPLAPTRLVLGKLLSRFVPVVGVLTAATLLALGSGGAALGTAAAWRDLGLWLAVVSAYAAFWLLLAALVNVRGRSSAENALTLATAWLVLTLLVPSALTVAATLRHPVPSRAEMVGVEREAAEAAQRRGAALLAAFYQDHPELAPASAGAGPVNFAAQSWAVQEEVERLTAPVRARYDEQAERQRTMIRRFRFLSPALLAQEALEDVAGTGEHRYRAFRDAVGAQRTAFRDVVGAKIVRGEPFRLSDVAALPSFDARSVTGDGHVARVLVSLAGLLLPSLALGALVCAQARCIRERARA